MVWLKSSRCIGFRVRSSACSLDSWVERSSTRVSCLGFRAYKVRMRRGSSMSAGVRVHDLGEPFVPLSLDAWWKRRDALETLIPEPVSFAKASSFRVGSTFAC